MHKSKKCLINQREVGVHTMSFATALRGALREDPDVILVGEMRDLETISLALTAAETGHLVFATLHTSSAPKTVDRIIDVFPAAQQEQIRIMFSESIQAVITQTLLKKRAGGRIAALEILIGTPAVRNLIREGKIHQIPSTMQTGQKVGMQTLDMALLDLVRRGIVTIEEAQATHTDSEPVRHAWRPTAGERAPANAARRRPALSTPEERHGHSHPAQADGRPQRLRPLPDRGQPSGGARRRRQPRPPRAEPLNAGDVEALANSLMTERQRAVFEEQLEMNLAISSSKLGRFRVNVFRQRGCVAVVDPSHQDRHPDHRGPASAADSRRQSR